MARTSYMIKNNTKRSIQAQYELL